MRKGIHLIFVCNLVFPWMIQKASFAETLRTERLPNDLNVVFLPQPSIPISTLTYVRSGGYSKDSKEKSGISKLIASYLERKLPDDGTIDLTEDILMVSMSSLPNEIESLFSQLGSMLDDKLLEEVIFNRIKLEQEIFLDERRASQTEFFLSEFKKAAWSGTPYGRPNTPQFSDYRKINFEDFRSAWRSWAQPKEGYLFVQGGGDSSKLTPLIQKHFGKLLNLKADPPIQNYFEAPWLKKSKRRGFVISQRNDPFSLLAFSGPGPQTGEQEQPGFTLLNALLGDGESSILATAIVEASQRAHQIQLKPEFMRFTTRWELLISMEPKFAAKIFECVWNAFSKLQSKEFWQRPELKPLISQALQTLRGRTIVAQTENRYRLMNILRSRLFEKDILTSTDTFEEGEPFSPENLHILAQKYFHPDKVLIGIMGDWKKLKADFPQTVRPWIEEINTASK